MSLNPFAVPDRDANDKRPLCPWRHAEHADLFIPVDHSEGAFQTFRGRMNDPETAISRRIVVIARGGEGCGKTALLHRSAHWLHSELRIKQIKSEIVDLTEEVPSALSADKRLAHWTSRLMDRIALQNLVTTAELKQDLLSRKSSPMDALPFLGDVLGVENMILHVLLPSIELLTEAQGLAGLAQPRLIFYTECSSDELQRALRTPGTTGLEPIIDLEVGVLNVDDGWKFVKARLDAVAQKTGLPLLSQATVKKYMTERIKGRGTTTIRELNLICAAVFADAQQRSRRRIEYNDFAAYYLRNGAL